MAEQCVDCHESCETCSLDGSRCETCPAGSKLGDTLCLTCGSRLTVQGDECASCGTACLECSTVDTCSKCEGDAILSAAGKCTCKDGFYMDVLFNTCKKCEPSCKTCTRGDQCETCPLGFELGATKCVKCATDEYVSGDSCAKCGPNCLNCDSGPNQCETCATGSVLQSDGTCACVKGKYFDTQF